MKVIYILSIFLFSFVSGSESGKSEVYVVDEFDQDLQLDWHGRSDNYSDVYSILQEEESNYLKAKSENSDHLIIKKIEVDIVEYPYLNWSWRVHTLPVNGDESVKEYCDVAASIALVTNKSRFFPKSIKYSWSSTLDADTRSKSPYSIWPARCDIHVIKSGENQIGKWNTEKVNVLQDYKSFYNKKTLKSKKIHAIVIMSDSDNTESISEADYDDIYFSKE